MNKLNQNQTDDFFRQALNQAPEQFPSENDWKLMERRLKPEPQRRPIIGWVYWTAGIAAALLIFFALFLSKETSMTEMQQAKRNQSEKESEKQTVQNNQAGNTGASGNENPGIGIKQKNDHAINSEESTISNQPQYSGSEHYINDNQNYDTPRLITDLREPFTLLPSAGSLTIGSNSQIAQADLTKAAPGVTISRSDIGSSAGLESENPPTNEKISADNPSGRWGLSIALSPDLNSVKGIDKSSLGISMGMGLSYKIGKSLSVGTGLYYSQKAYDSDKTSYKTTVKPFSTWTSYSRKIEADCRVLDIPLNLNMLVKSGPQGKILASAGVSSYIMLSETYNFIYNPTPAYPSKGREYTIKNENKHILSVVNLAVGFEKPVSKQVSLVIQPYAKIPLSGIGQGETNLKSYGVGFQLNYSLKKKQSLLKSGR